MQIDIAAQNTGNLDDEERAAVAARIGTCTVCEQAERITVLSQVVIIYREPKAANGVAATAVCGCGAIFYLKNDNWPPAEDGRLLDGWDWI